MLIYLLRYEKCLLRRPVEGLAQGFYIFLTQRLAVCACFSLFCRASVTDLCLDRNKGRMLCICLCSLDGSADGVSICTILDHDRLEAECTHTLLNILAECNIGASFDGDPVGIIQYDQLSEA